MINVFYMLTFFTIIFLISEIIVKKDYFSLNIYILLGIYLPLMVSSFDWSYLHISERPNSFYIVFCFFDLFAIMANLLPQKSIKFENLDFKKNKKIIPIEVYNVIYIICILIENYVTSGYLFPSLYGIDIHTARMPYIYFITTGIYIVSIMNLIEYFSTKNKKYIIYIIILVGFNIVSKSARIDAFICATQLLSIILLYYFNNKKIIRKDNVIIKKKKKKIKSIISVGLIAGIIVYVGLSVGKNRMNSNGKYDIEYTDGIKYKGPLILGDLLPYYYGYFPLSFDNLAYNMENTEIKPNYIGLCSFRTLYFGIFQLDNILNLDGGVASRANHIRSKASAVATGFWDFYYDFHEFFFVPIIISFLIYYILKLKVCKEKNSVLALAIYFYWIPLWFFLSFDNRIYDYQVLMHILLMMIIMPRRYILIVNSSEETEESDLYSKEGIRA